MRTAIEKCNGNQIPDRTDAPNRDMPYTSTEIVDSPQRADGNNYHEGGCSADRPATAELPRSEHHKTINNRPSVPDRLGIEELEAIQWDWNRNTYINSNITTPLATSATANLVYESRHLLDDDALDMEVGVSTPAEAFFTNVRVKGN